jgi:hypothetical protein
MLKSQHIGDRSAHLYTQWAALEHSAGALPGPAAGEVCGLQHPDANDSPIEIGLITGPASLMCVQDTM